MNKSVLEKMLMALYCNFLFKFIRLQTELITVFFMQNTFICVSFRLSRLVELEDLVDSLHGNFKHIVNFLDFLEYLCSQFTTSHIINLIKKEIYKQQMFKDLQ